MANLVAVKNNPKVIVVTLPAGLSATTTLCTLTVSLKEFESSILFCATGTSTGSSRIFYIKS